MADGREPNPNEAPELELTPPPTPPGPPTAGGAAAPLPAGGPASAPTPPQAPRPNLLDRLPGWTAPALLVGIPLLIWLACLAFPAVYRDFVWRYYWGPIRADAENVRSLVFEGVEAHSGYNFVNTASWALLMGICILGVAQLLRRTKTPMTPRLIVGAAGWVVAGSVFHVMEDAALFQPPLEYFFITPPIYLLFTLGGVLSLVVGHYLRGVGARAGVGLATQKMWMLIAAPVVGYLILWSQGWDQVTHYVNPFWVALFALVGFVLAARHARRHGNVDPIAFVGHMSVPWILLAIAYVIGFVQAERAGAPWFPSHNPIREALWAVPLAAGVALLAFAVGLVTVGRFERLGARKARDFSFALLQPINLLLLFSQLLDAFATSIGIDLGHYTEKHVLSNKIIGWTCGFSGAHWDADGQACIQQDEAWFGLAAHYPTFVGFATVKLLVSLFVIYAIDVSGKDDAQRNPTVIGLVKLAIIMVGLGPGIRDFVRMSLGV